MLPQLHWSWARSLKRQKFLHNCNVLDPAHLLSPTSYQMFTLHSIKQFNAPQIHHAASYLCALSLQSLLSLTPVPRPPEKTLLHLLLNSVRITGLLRRRSHLLRVVTTLQTTLGLFYTSFSLIKVWVPQGHSYRSNEQTTFANSVFDNKIACKLQ